MTLLISVAAAVGGTVSFSLLFGVPTKYYPYCGLIGGAGWAVYSILIQSSTAPGAALFATIVVILLSRLFAVRERCQVTIFLISGLFPLEEFGIILFVFVDFLILFFFLSLLCLMLHGMICY